VVKKLGLPLPAKLAYKYGPQAGKPVLVNTFGSPYMKELLHKKLDKYRIPIIISIQNCVKTLAKMLQYHHFKVKNLSSVF